MRIAKYVCDGFSTFDFCFSDFTFQCGASAFACSFTHDICDQRLHIQLYCELCKTRDICVQYITMTALPLVILTVSVTDYDPDRLARGRTERLIRRVSSRAACMCNTARLSVPRRARRPTENLSGLYPMLYAVRAMSPTHPPSLAGWGRQPTTHTDTRLAGRAAPQAAAPSTRQAGPSHERASKHRLAGRRAAHHARRPTDRPTAPSLTHSLTSLTHSPAHCTLTGQARGTKSCL